MLFGLQELNSLRTNLPWCLILGGAALQCCGNRLIFSAEFSRCGQIAAQRGNPANTYSSTKQPVLMRRTGKCRRILFVLWAFLYP